VNDQEEKKQIPVPVVVAACIAALGFMGWWGYKNFGPQDTPKTSKNIEVDNYLAEMAKKSGGDWNKLTPEEQAKVNSMTANRGAMALAGLARGKAR
jgi:hypothetical protein